MNAPVNPSAIDRAIEQMREQTAASVAKVIDAGAKAAIKEPWRIAVALGYRAIWPVEITVDNEPHVLTTREVLDQCGRKIGEERNRGRAGHWTFSMSRLIALLQAEAALTAMVEEGR